MVNFLKKNKIVIQYFFFILFCSVNFVLMLLHEPWRDEIHAWSMAEFLSIKDLFIVSRFDGHPILWHLIIMPFAKLHFPIITLNIISWIIVSISAWLFIFKTKLNDIFKFVVLFTVPFLYAFSAISRNYCLVLLFLMIIAVFYDKRYTHPIIYAILISFLIHTHSLAWGVVAGLTITFYMYELFLYIFKHKRELNIRPIIIGFIIIVFNTLLVVFELYGSTNPDFLVGLYDSTKKIIIYIILIVMSLFILTIKFAKENIKEYVVVAISLLFHILVYVTFYSIVLLQRYMLIYAIFLFFIILLSNANISRKALRIFCIAYIVTIILLGAIQDLFKYIIADAQAPYSSAKYMATYINENLSEEDTILVDSIIICQTMYPYLEHAHLYDIVNDDYIDNIKYMTSLGGSGINKNEVFSKENLSKYHGKYIIFSSYFEVINNLEHIIYYTPPSISGENYCLCYIE